jgi:glycosyltransferase involved in cell wall biosynthesis
VRLLYLFPEELTGRFAREYHVYRLAESLAASGCDVTLAAAPSAQGSTPEQLHDLFGGTAGARLSLRWLKRELALGPWKVRSGAWFFRQLDRVIDALQPDLVFTMHLKAADHVAGRHSSLPLVFEAHEIFADAYAEGNARHRRLTDLEERIYRHVRGVVAISGYLADQLRSRYGLSAPVHVQHDGIDAGMLLDTSVEPAPNELIYVGSLQPWKGVPVAIAAMRLLPDFHLTVVGGEGKALENLRRNAPANVTFLGQLSRPALRPFLQKASLGLMPNLLEPRNALSTFPLKLLEYSAAGKGIVASRIPAFEGLSVDGWVELAPSGSPEALAAGVRARAGKQIDRRGAQAWATQFLWEKQGQNLKAFLETLRG